MNGTPNTTRRRLLFTRAAAVMLLAAGLCRPAVAEKSRAELLYFGETGCAHCDTFVSKDLPRAEHETGVDADCTAIDVLSDTGYARCVAELAAKGDTFRVFPVLVIGNNAYQGNAAIEANLAAELAAFGKTGAYRPKITGDTRSGAGGAGTLTLAVIPVIAAGLIDGINPCAFATMLFFMSWISLGGGGKKRMLFAGLAFTGGVFAAYFLIGLGFSGIIRTASGFVAVRQIIRAGFALAAIVLSVLSFVDAVRARRGKPGEMSLQLPGFLKKSVHRAIKKGWSRNGTITPAALATLVLTGMAVAALELACTGQIYFPTIAYMVQSSAGSFVPMAWLLLYNISFLLPLGAVLALCVAGTELAFIRNFFSRTLFAGKIAIGILFAGLAALMILV